MAAASIEHRPKSTDKEATVSQYVIVTGCEEKHGSFKTQHEAKDKACAKATAPSTSPASAICRTATTQSVRKRPLLEWNYSIQ